MHLLAEFFYQWDSCIIWCVFAINVVIFIALLFGLRIANKQINPTANKRYKVNVSVDWENRDVLKLARKRNRLVFGYTLYANLTAIFPLLGILGTVAALIQFSGETMLNDFMVALATTLLGVFFAILFKVADAFVSGPLDVFLEEADHIIQHFDA